MDLLKESLSLSFFPRTGQNKQFKQKIYIRSFIIWNQFFQKDASSPNQKLKTIIEFNMFKLVVVPSLSLRDYFDLFDHFVA